MKRTPLKGRIFMLLGSIAAGFTLFAVLSYLNRESGLAFCTASSDLGWTIPLITGLLVAGVVVLLLGSAEHEDGESSEMRASTCSTCGSQIINEWRMCPHCGELLECDVALPSTSLLER